MKVRQDFVTNSSSSSYIIFFARVADMEKARPIIEKHNLELLDVAGVDEKRNWCGTLGADWCGAEIYSATRVTKEHPNDKYIVLKDSVEAEYSEYGDPIFSYDFSINNIIEDINVKNGFADIEESTGEGRDG